MSFLINPYAFLAAGGDYESIATVTVGSGGASSMEFTSIPSTYQHLQVRIVARTNRSATGDQLGVRLNSDSGSNYAYHQLEGDGSSASAYGETGKTWGYAGYGAASATASASIFGATVLDILDYGDMNKNTVLRLHGSYDSNGAGRVNLASALWVNTAAVTSVVVIPLNGTSFAQHSTAALYGLKAPA